MRFSIVSLTACLSILFTFAAALPVLETREPVTHAQPRGAAKSSGHGTSARACSIHKRSFEFEFLERRNLADHELSYQIGPKVGGGSYGDVHSVVGQPELLAKSANAKAGMKSASIAEFKEEAEHLKHVGQLVDWGYKTDAACNKVYYIIMKKVSGTPFPRTHAYLATAGNKAARKALVDKVIGMVANKMMDYVKHTTILHSDPNGSNVLCTEDAHHNIVSVDLVDWGIATKVDVRHMTHAIAMDIAREALQRMY